MASNPLIRAAIAGNAARIEKLLAREDIRELAKQPVNKTNSQTALIIAAVNGDVDCVKLLAPVSDVAQEGGFPHAEGSPGRSQSALSVAVEQARNPAHLECVRILAPLTLPRVGVHDVRALLQASLAHDSSECLSVLLAEPAAAAGGRVVSTSTDTRDGHATEATLLMEWQCMRNLGHVRALVPFSDPNAVDRKGEHVLIHAMQADQGTLAKRAGTDGADRVRLLLAAGANPAGDIREYSDYEKSPLARAALAGYAVVVDAMLPASEPRAIHDAARTLMREIPPHTSDDDWLKSSLRGQPAALDRLCAVDLSSDKNFNHSQLQTEVMSRFGAKNMPKTYALVEAREIAQALNDARPRVDLAAAQSNAPTSTAKDESTAVSATRTVAHATPSLRRSGVASGPRRM